VHLIRVPVDVPGAEYVVHVGEGALRHVGRIVPPPGPGRAAAVVADDTTAGLFGEQVIGALAEADWRPRLVAVRAGEASKTLETTAYLYERLAEGGIDRGSAVFALGGGVVGDLAGFAAATYLRGVAFVPLPTTLLAQVDSSVGGKVGVDLPRAKNLVGAFHQPTAVVADPATLRTLPKRQVAAGMAEVVKHAAIADAALFRELEERATDVLALDTALLTRIVAANCRIKASVVARDPLERGGLRAVLNYGHTIGHALERAAASWSLLHGEAVAVGMVAEARAAARLGLVGSEAGERLAALLAAFGLPLKVPRGGVDPNAAQAALAADKKIVSGGLTLPIVPGIGSVELRGDVPVAALAEELQRILA